jgi:cobalt-zinc-cadmium efflux system outer membrane protein
LLFLDFQEIRMNCLSRSRAAAACTAALLWAAAGANTAAQAQTLAEWASAAWRRQPEAASTTLRQQALHAQTQAAQSWTPEPPALQLSTQTDRLHRNAGSREHEVGIAVPLWLPGERARTAELARAETTALDARLQAAQCAQVDVQAAAERLGTARQLAADVARRVQRGDLARADQHQADGATATAQAEQASAQAQLAEAAQRLRALAGMVPNPQTTNADAEPAPTLALGSADWVEHPAVAEAWQRWQTARAQVALLERQQRANPELTVSTTRTRDGRGEPSAQSLTLALRVPFGGGDRHRAKLAQAQADALEAGLQWQSEQQRVAADWASAQAKADAAQAQLAAAQERHRLAAETRGFFAKSFSLGETDLPTRLRTEAEAADAARQLQRARVELAAAKSVLRQAAGLLPAPAPTSLAGHHSGAPQ